MLHWLWLWHWLAEQLTIAIVVVTNVTEVIRVLWYKNIFTTIGTNHLPQYSTPMESRSNLSKWLTRIKHSSNCAIPSSLYYPKYKDLMGMPVLAGRYPSFSLSNSLYWVETRFCLCWDLASTTTKKSMRHSVCGEPFSWALFFCFPTVEKIEVESALRKGGNTTGSLTGNTSNTSQRYTEQCSLHCRRMAQQAAEHISQLQQHCLQQQIQYSKRLRDQWKYCQQLQRRLQVMQVRRL